MRNEGRSNEEIPHEVQASNHEYVSKTFDLPSLQKHRTTVAEMDPAQVVKTVMIDHAGLHINNEVKLAPAAADIAYFRIEVRSIQNRSTIHCVVGQINNFTMTGDPAWIEIAVDGM